MTKITLSEIQSLEELVRLPKTVALMHEAAVLAPRQMSAEEFMNEFALYIQKPAQVGVKLGGKIGYKFSKSLGIRSTTNQSARLDASYGAVALSLLCAVVRQGCRIESIEEIDRSKHFIIEGQIPSSALNYDGTILVEGSGSPNTFYEVHATVIFPGQLVAWGKGRRMLQKMISDARRYVQKFSDISL